MPNPTFPAPFTYTAGLNAGLAPMLRSDVANATALLTQPPVFQGTQSGVPLSCTGLQVTNQVTAPGSAYPTGTSVIFTGSSLPGGITAGTIYTVANPAGDVFQLNGVTITSNGSGTVQQVQEIGSGTWQGIVLDTTGTDQYGAHLASTQPAYAYAMIPGIYLAEATFPAFYSGGTGTLAAGITAQEDTSPVAISGGQSVPQSGTPGVYAQVSAARLLSFSVAGSYGAPGNNFAYAAVVQDTGTVITPLITATRMPQLTLEWVRGLPAPAGSVTETLPVPGNDAWPAGAVSRNFLNKNVRDTIQFLAARPACEAYMAATVTLAAQSSLPAVGIPVALDTAHIDPRGTFSPSTGTWTAPVPGVYEVTGQVPVLAASTSQAAAAGLTVQSAGYNGGSPFTVWGPVQAACTGTGQTSCAVARRRLRLNAGDTVGLAGFQADSSSASATIPGTGAGPYWRARLITIWRAA